MQIPRMRILEFQKPDSPHSMQAGSALWPRSNDPAESLPPRNRSAAALLDSTGKHRSIGT